MNKAIIILLLFFYIKVVACWFIVNDMTILLKEGKLCQFRDSNNYRMNLALATNSRGWGGFNILDFPYNTPIFSNYFQSYHVAG